MTDFTRSFHHKPYDAISQSLPSLTCKDMTVLVTGASEGIGYAIAKAFASAQASQIVLVGRRPHALSAAITSLTAELGSISTTTFESVTADVFDETSILRLWQELADRNISIDGLVLNAAKTKSDGSVRDEIASFTANVTANIVMLDCFSHKQTVTKDGNERINSRTKFCINISSMAAHWNPAWPGQQAYCASKAAFASYIQHVASQTEIEECLMFNLHPGAIYTPAAERARVPIDSVVWDDAELAGNFCVWLSKQTFLHGRFVWINWDAEELIAMKDRLLQDPGMLKIGLQGVEHVVPDKHFEVLRQRQQSCEL